MRIASPASKAGCPRPSASTGRTPRRTAPSGSRPSPIETRREECQPNGVHTELTSSESADRLAIRELFDAYGQSTVTIEGDRATGESYTLAHHLFSEEGKRKMMVASLRYLDTFAKIDGGWYFAERKLLVDWSETRPSTPGP